MLFPGKISVLMNYLVLFSISTLFGGQDARAKIFKKYMRPLNNALALACLKTKTPEVPGGGYNSSVKFKEKYSLA